MLSRICNPVIRRAPSAINRSTTSLATRRLSSLQPRISIALRSSQCGKEILPRQAIRVYQGRRTIGTTPARFADLPEHKLINLPALSPTMEMGTIVSWQKKEGDQLSEGDLLCEIETDKATMGFETPEEGYLARIFEGEGAKDIPIGKLLCIIVPTKEDVAAFKDIDRASLVETESVGAPSKSAAAAPQPKVEAPSTPPPSTPHPTTAHHAAQTAPGGRVKASPYAKKIAADQGVDLSTVSGSGPHGRILAADVASAPQHAPGAEPDYQDIQLSNMRRTIAKRLTESKSTIPHYYLTSEIIVDNLLNVRTKLNALLEKQSPKGEKPQKISINDFIIKASALACLRVPEANSFFMDTFVRQHNNVDVSVAVSTDVGLITPIVFNAHHKGLATISSDVASLAAKAREGKLQPHEFLGGTFTVSNLGMFGSVDHFTAIINPPQSCILAIGASKRKLVPGENENEHKVVTALKVTLSCDHRVVDGAVGALWLKHFKSFLEQPHTMLL
ncbi:2-oxoacid dehydrogenases acyltransferase (catalytic domain) domain-containing protein [Ditylenchus destructor]|nr:2-oxoacid dehydrogenases acyltransferase (catalytic domain) domain-containing protein [Ditylenchus destructor]